MVFVRTGLATAFAAVSNVGILRNSEGSPLFALVLEFADSRGGDTTDFLGVTPGEAAFVDLKRTLARRLREYRDGTARRNLPRRRGWDGANRRLRTWKPRTLRCRSTS